MSPALFRVAKAVVWFVYIWVLIDIGLLFMAFILQLFGANPNAEFAQWIYRSAARPMEPFRGLFPSHAITSQSVLNTSLLFAMIIYSMVAVAFRAAIDWLSTKVTVLESQSAPACQASPVTATSRPQVG